MERVTVYCRSCGAPNSADGAFCTRCGSRMPAVCYCPQCGELAQPGEDLCPRCGQPLEKNGALFEERTPHHGPEHWHTTANKGEDTAFSAEADVQKERPSPAGTEETADPIAAEYGDGSKLLFADQDGETEPVFSGEQVDEILKAHAAHVKSGVLVLCVLSFVIVCIVYALNAL